MKNVTAAILIHDGKILIAKRGPGDKFFPNKWKFPGGKIEKGETPEECLKREMMEGFQIEVEVGEFLGESEYHYSYGAIKLSAYRTFLQPGDMSPKVLYNWVPVSQLKDFDFSPADVPFVEMLRRGEIEV